ncbi:hypothetical protein AB6809_33945 [Paraburkholderia sp. RCC_158]|uniref:hypothetical protein n=1 Tax=Paraburkholderia sp. RCC_158 TaxID=3239220 RepID=UPI003523909B
MEAGPLVYDVAICLPSEGAGKTDGPVYASHDLFTRPKVHCAYTVLAGRPLDDVAAKVAGWTLDEYAQQIATPGHATLWETAVLIAATIGLELDAEALRHRYGATRRTSTTIV